MHFKRESRIYSLLLVVFSVDQQGKPLRKSHENPLVKELYSDFFLSKPNSGKAHTLLHTHYTDRSVEVRARSEKAFGALPPAVDNSHEY